MSDLINFTQPQFSEIMRTQGLGKTALGVVEVFAEDNQENDLKYSELKDGTSSYFDKMPSFKNQPPEKRGLSDEQILSLFTNVRDFGVFESKEKADDAKSEARKYGAVRAIPEAIGGTAGFVGGVKAVAPVASLIPPIGPIGIGARGLTYLIGGLGGSIGTAIAAGEVEDAVFGEADPVLPQFQSAYNFGETATIFAPSLLTPWALIPKNVSKGGTAALDFLNNFKNVSTGKFVQQADEAFEITAKNAGLTPKAFESAIKAREAATKGPMFGGALGTNIGFSRFNPAGFVFDPRKGPLSTRALAATESGIQRSLQAAKDRPKTFLAVEGASGVGAALGASIAQDIFPYDEKYKVVGELIGTAIVPFPVQVGADYAPDVVKTAQNWWSNRNNTGILRDKLEKDSVNRILQAIQRSEEYADTLDDAGKGVTADEKLQYFIDEIFKASKDADGNPVEFTLADLAESKNLPFSATVRTISQELEKSSEALKGATSRGREQMRVGAENAISTLTATGDPKALALAARLQQSLFEQNIIDNLDLRVSKLYDDAKRVLGRDPEGGSTRVDLSLNLYEILKNQISLSKVRERKLWDEVGSFTLTEFRSRNGRTISQPNVLQLLGRSSRKGGLKFASIGSQQKFEKSLGDTMGDIEVLKEYFQKEKGRNPATAQRFFEMRSDVLDEAARLRNNGQIKAAERLNKVANALLQDLTGQTNGVSAQYNAARAYTFARNNVFTRSFINDLQTVDKTRGLVMDPQALLDNAFRGSPNQTALRFEQIRAAGNFLIDNAGFSEEQVRSLDTDGIINAALRDSLSQVVDQRTVVNPNNPDDVRTVFKVNENKLNNFLKKPGTQELFSILGDDFEKDLKDVKTAQSSLDNFLTDASDIINPSQARKANFSEEQIKRMYARKAFQSVLEFEDPGKAVAQALKSPRPTLALNELYNTIRDANFSDQEYTKDQAYAGLKSAIFQHAFTAAGGSSINGNVLQKELFSQMKGVDPSVKFSLKDFLEKKGLVSTEEGPDGLTEMERVQKAVKTLRGVEEAFATGNYENVLFKNPSLAKLFYVRIAGATAGSAVQNKLKSLLGLPQMSGGLIAEQTGSELVQRLLLKGPESQRVKIMTELFADPAKLAPLLKEVKNQKDADNAISSLASAISPLARQVGRRLPIVTGVTTEDRLEPVVEEEEEASVSIPPPPPVQSPPPVASPTTTAANSLPSPVTSGAIGQAGSSNTLSRGQQLFPNDPIFRTFKEGGIVTLMRQ
ncbi:MAG: hypothetical protein CMC70_01425 [Flavobacteriaceae bacterium]|nr:hypothetical protein [Flavobacteriaceae bacterium]